jgi:hypothetical protein
VAEHAIRESRNAALSHLEVEVELDAEQQVAVRVDALHLGVVIAGRRKRRQAVLTREEASKGSDEV